MNFAIPIRKDLAIHVHNGGQTPSSDSARIDAGDEVKVIVLAIFLSLPAQVAGPCIPLEVCNASEF